jgi:WD40 repeat protein
MKSNTGIRFRRVYPLSPNCQTTWKPAFEQRVIVSIAAAYCPYNEIMKTQHTFFLTLILLFTFAHPTFAQDSIRPDSCPAALPSRLVHGARGRVLPGVSNRLRAEPSAESEILVEIPAGDIFTVLEGFTCAEDMAWWQVRYGDQTGWTAEGQGETYWLEPSLLPELEPISATNVSRLQPIAMLGDGFISEVAWSPDGQTLLVAGLAGLWRYDLTQPEKWPYLIEGYEGLFSSLAYSLDGKFIATGSDTGAIRLWDTTTWTETAVLQASGAMVKKLAFSADGKYLASAGYDGTLQLWDFDAGVVTTTWTFDGRISDLAFSPDSVSLAVTYPYSGASIFNLHTGSRIDLKRLDFPWALAFNADGSMLAVGNRQSEGGPFVPHIPVTVFDAQTGEIVFAIGAEAFYSVYALAFADQDKLVIGLREATDSWQLNDLRASTPMSDQDIAEFYFRDDIKYPVFEMDRDKIPHLSFPGGKFFRLNPDRTRAAIVDTNGNAIHLVDLDVPNVQITLSLPFFDQITEGFTQAVAFSPTQPLLAFGADDDIQLTNIATGIPQSVLKGHRREITALSFNTDGTLLASGSGYFSPVAPSGSGEEEGGARVWGVADGSLKAVFNGYVNPVSRLRFSPDSKLLFTAFEQGGWNYEEQAYFLWDWAANVRTQLDAVTSFPTYLTFSPQPHLAALVMNNAESGSSFSLLDTERNLKIPLVENGENLMSEADFNADGTLVVAGSAIWNVETGESVSLGGTALNAVFSADDSLLAYYFYGEIVIWDVKAQAERTRIPVNFGSDAPLFFSLDGTLIAKDGKLWDVQTGAMMIDMFPMRTPNDYFLTAQISADGKVIAIPDRLGVRLWGVPAAN